MADDLIERLNPEALTAAYEANKAHAADPGRKGSGLEKAIVAYLAALRAQPTSPSGVPSDAAREAETDGLYAVFYGGLWAVCSQVPASAYGLSGVLPIWSETRTTAFVCEVGKEKEFVPLAAYAIDRPLASKQDAGSGEAGEWAAFSASDRACYLYPNDDPTSKLLRHAYIEGAAFAIGNTAPAAPTADPRVKALIEAAAYLARSARTVFGALDDGQALLPVGLAHTQQLIGATEQVDAVLDALEASP